MKKIVVLSGAGISAESGLKTFRDSDGLWEGHKVEEVATPGAWAEDPENVLRFYNQRRKQLLEVKPHSGHISLAELERAYHVEIITQNVDDLHERAGSSNVLHLHGELLKVRSVDNEDLVLEWEKDLNLGDCGSDGKQLRPHIVWFGEAVPMLEKAIVKIQDADIVVIVGTSMVVYPAASLIHYAPPYSQVYYIDPNPNINHELSLRPNFKIIPEKATIGIPILLENLNQQ